MVSDARAWGRAALPVVLGHPPGDDLAGDVELLLSELVANAVRHGGGVDRVTLTADAGCVRIDVRDHEPGEPAVSRDPGRESGWGLLIVDRLAAEWGVQHHPGDGKSVWLSLSL